MQIVKVLSIMVSMVLLTSLIVAGLGVISRLPIMVLGVAALVIVIGAIVWGNRMDTYASQSWFKRMDDMGATTAHDTLLQHIDADREYTHQRLRRRHHDAA